MDDKEEKILLSALKKGNKEVYELLFKKYYAELVAYARFMVKDLSIAEKIAKESFINFWKLKGDITCMSSFKTGLFSSFNQNYQVNAPKKHKAKNIFLAMPPEVDLGSLEFEYPKLEHQIFQQIEMLPQPCKKIFMLNRFYGLNYKSIAEKLKTREEVVVCEMGTALKLLYDNLAENIPTISKLNFLAFVYR